jgi:hypothetical protein
MTNGTRASYDPRSGWFLRNQQYFSLTTNQHQPPATGQPNEVSIVWHRSRACPHWKKNIHKHSALYSWPPPSTPPLPPPHGRRGWLHTIRVSTPVFLSSSSPSLLTWPKAWPPPRVAHGGVAACSTPLCLATPFTGFTAQREIRWW